MTTKYMNPIRYFDTAATTQCCEEAAHALLEYSANTYGNPSSNNAMGEKSAQAIRVSRKFFSEYFEVAPDQVIFTSCGSEANNLAIYGVMMAQKARGKSPIHALCTSVEHPCVKKSVLSLATLDCESGLIPVDRQGVLQSEEMLDLIQDHTQLVSVMKVNNITGAEFDVEAIAARAKCKNPDLIFHSDCIQAFTKVNVPKAGSPVDMVSLSAHKVHGPKGIGALIILNRKILEKGLLRPIIWGGGQEGGLRSGTESPGLISAFQLAAQRSLNDCQGKMARMTELREGLRHELESRKLLSSDPEDKKSPIRWNSPKNAVPYIVSLSIPGTPSAPLAKFLEERNCIVATGSACSSKLQESDPILKAMGFDPKICQSALRISFGCHHTLEDVQALAQALQESIDRVSRLQGRK